MGHWVKSSRGILGLSLIWLSVGLSASANLLLNPSFESGNGSPDYWWSGVIGSSGGAWYWNNDPDKARTGSRLVATGFWGSPNTSYWGQTISAVPNTPYVFTVWAKTEENFSGSYYLLAEFQDASYQTIWTNRSAVLSGQNTTYHQLSLTTDPAPAGTAYIAFSMRAEGGLYTVMWDDASVVAIPEPSTAALVAAGLGIVFWTVRRKVG